MPVKLEVLHIEGTFLNVDDFDSRGVRVFLAPFKSLSLCSPVYNMVTFLPQIIVSQNCQVGLRSHIFTHWEYTVSSSTSECFWPYQSFVNDSPKNFLQSFGLYISEDIVQVRAFHEVVSHEDLIDGDPLYELTFDYYTDDPSETLLRFFLATLPLARLVFLEVSRHGPFNIFPSVWRENFCQIPTLKKIILDAGSWIFFSLLQSPNLLFPNLTSVTVKEYWVCDEDILESLRARSKLGAPLQEILLSSEPSPDILEQPQEVVQHVGIDHSPPYVPR